MTQNDLEYNTLDSHWLKDHSNQHTEKNATTVQLHK